MTRVEMDNIVRISSSKEIGEYIRPIVERMSPKVYKKYGCIKIRFTGNLSFDVDKIMMRLWHAGLKYQEGSCKPVQLKTARGEIIDKAFEISFTKIGAIQFEDDSEYISFLADLKKSGEEDES